MTTSAALNVSLEKIKRRFTKRIRGFKELSCKKRLETLSIQSLVQSCICHDLVLTFKCLYGYTAISPDSLGLQVFTAPTRAKSICLVHYKAKSTNIA